MWCDVMCRDHLLGWSSWPWRSPRFGSRPWTQPSCSQRLPARRPSDQRTGGWSLARCLVGWNDMMGGGGNDGCDWECVRVVGEGWNNNRICHENRALCCVVFYCRVWVCHWLTSVHRVIERDGPRISVLIGGSRARHHHGAHGAQPLHCQSHVVGTGVEVERGGDLTLELQTKHTSDNVPASIHYHKVNARSLPDHYKT